VLDHSPGQTAGRGSQRHWEPGVAGAFASERKSQLGELSLSVDIALRNVCGVDTRKAIEEAVETDSQK
jgi:hypothetical protein